MDGPPCYLSGRRESNPRPSAWEADALPAELLPLLSAEALAKAEFCSSNLIKKYVQPAFILTTTVYFDNNLIF